MGQAPLAMSRKACHSSPLKKSAPGSWCLVSRTVGARPSEACLCTFTLFDAVAGLVEVSGCVGRVHLHRPRAPFGEYVWPSDRSRANCAPYWPHPQTGASPTPVSQPGSWRLHVQGPRTTHAGTGGRQPTGGLPPGSRGPAVLGLRTRHPPGRTRRLCQAHRADTAGVAFLLYLRRGVVLVLLLCTRLKGLCD